MSIATASLLGFLMLSVLTVTVNGFSIRLLCEYPSSELCKLMHQRLNNLIRFENDVGDPNLRHINVQEEDFGDSQELRNPLEGFLRHPFPTNEELVRCINLGDDSCNNGSLPGSGKDHDYLNGNGNPGKRFQTDRHSRLSAR